MKLYALCTLHEVRSFDKLMLLDMPLTAFLFSQTGWGTRAGIGDASAATAAADADTNRNEKSAANNPYNQPSYQQQPSQQLSPFRDQASPSPYRDSPTPSTATPVYTSQTQQKGQMRRRGDFDDGVEMQVGYAR